MSKMSCMVEQLIIRVVGVEEPVQISQQLLEILKEGMVVQADVCSISEIKKVELGKVWNCTTQ